jgi:hypothetical protein
MLQSRINDMFSIKKELNIPVSVCSVPYSSSVTSISFAGCNGSHPSHHTNYGVKNPAYKSINNSQTINADKKDQD